MTIYSIFGASLAASVIAGPLLFPGLDHETAPSPATRPGPASPDATALIVFDAEGRQLGRAKTVVATNDGRMVAWLADARGPQTVVMVRGADGMLRLVAE